MRHSQSERQRDVGAKTAVADGPLVRVSPVIVGKLIPPEVPAGVIVRDRLLDPWGEGSRVLTIIAAAGCGKSIAAQQIVDADHRPFGWLNVDSLDSDPSTFWRHLIGALRWAEPAIDDGPEQLLAARGATDPAFLTALISAIETSGTPATIVIDGVSALTDRSVLDGLALLIDRVGDVVRFVVVGRRLPELPIGRWRAQGWVCEIDDDALRFTEAEANDAIALLPDVDLEPAVAAAVAARAQGWATGVVLAARSVTVAGDAALAAQQLSGADRLFAQYFATEMLDQLTADERRTVLSLSVLRTFDAQLCCDLLGNEAVAVAHHVCVHPGFLANHDPHTGTVRLHPLMREMLEHELMWLDPELRQTLHRRAATLLQERGDFSGAHRHLVAVGEVQAAAELVLRPVLALVDRGDRLGLAQLTRLLPLAAAHDDAPFAFDVAVAWLFVGNLAEASRWCDTGDEMMPSFDIALRQRSCAVRGMIALLGGEVAAALAQVAEFEQAGHAGTSTAVEGRFATTAARVMLAAGRFDDAAMWVDQALTIDGPPVVTDVTVPALDAWLAFAHGQLGRATELATAACARAEALGARPHHGASEALVVAGWCHVAVGDLAAASEKCEAACADAELLGVPWNRIRGGVLAAEIQRLSGAPEAAVAILRDLRADLDLPTTAGHLAEEIDIVEALLQEHPALADHPQLAKVRAGQATLRVRGAGAHHDRLTPRELRLLHFLPSHLSYAEIGEGLFISVNTVKTNLKALYRKLGASTRAEAVEAAARAGLLNGGNVLTASDVATAARASAH